MGGIETLVILPVASFNLSVMSRCKRANELMSYSMLLQMHLKKGWFIILGCEAVGKLGTVVRLDTVNRQRKCFYQMVYKHGGRISAVFLKCLNKTPSGVLVDSGILEEMFSDDTAVFEA